MLFCWFTSPTLLHNAMRKFGTFFRATRYFNIFWMFRPSSLLRKQHLEFSQTVLTWNCRPMPFFLAKSSIIAVGSDPIDRRQIIGVLGSLSSHMALRSRITGSAYFGPIESEMYLRACDVVLSGHHDLQHTHTDNRSPALSVSECVSSILMTYLCEVFLSNDKGQNISTS